MTTIEHVTCLGCGCGCDDLTVEVADGRIVNVTPVCPIGRAWFGDGKVPSEVRVSGRPATLEDAVQEVAQVLAESVGRCLMYLGPDISSQTQRATLALSDLLRATVDTPTSATAAAGLLAGQRRGRATATLGEIRSRADVMVFWGVDPAERYPRYLARYGPKSVEARIGTQVERSLVVAVSIGNDPAPAGADLSLTLHPDQEIAALSLMRASVLGQNVPAPSPAIAPAIELAGRLSRAGYAVLVYDGDPVSGPANPLRGDALIALTQALNTPTRAALSVLRAGGNRVGAEAVLTSQTGYPFAVDYARGYPAYQPAKRGLDRLANGGHQVLLIVGTPPEEPTSFGRAKKGRTMIIGPRASESRLRPHVAIDTGVAGIHESGTGYRMDEVPLELTPPLPANRSAMDVVAAVLAAVSRIVPRSPR